VGVAYTSSRARGLPLAPGRAPSHSGDDEEARAMTVVRRAAPTSYARGGVRRACPVCDARTAIALHHQAFVLPDGHPLADGYDVVCCQPCGFVYADTDVPQEAYERFYSDSSKYADVQTSTGGGDLPWDDRRLEETAGEITRHLPNRDARIVDVGCANGGLLKWLSAAGYRALHGVDPARACAVAAERFPNVRGHVGSLFDLPAEVRDADLLILSHVLEHVRDIGRAMNSVFEVVRSGGRVYVEVPDATRYADCLSAPLQDFNTEHINHFSPHSLRSLLGRHGFELVAAGQKTIEAAAGVPYPALWAVATRRPARHGALPVGRDDSLQPAIERYIARSLELIARIDAHLERELAGVSELVVWGTGQTTLKLLAVTALRHANIVAFADANPVMHGKRLRGAPIMAPERLGQYTQPILVGSIISREPIARRIRELGLENRLIFLDAWGAS
jgi:SAM-dependent methyltransferase